MAADTGSRFFGWPFAFPEGSRVKEKQNEPGSDTADICQQSQACGKVGGESGARNQSGSEWNVERRGVKVEKG